MTVQEIIKELEKYPQDYRIVVPDYEDGFDDIHSIRQVKIKNFEPAKWYYGRYDETKENGDPAVLFVRTPNIVD